MSEGASGLTPNGDVYELLVTPEVVLYPVLGTERGVVSLPLAGLWLVFTRLICRVRRPKCNSSSSGSLSSSSSLGRFSEDVLDVESCSALIVVGWSRSYISSEFEANPLLLTLGRPSTAWASNARCCMANSDSEAGCDCGVDMLPCVEFNVGSGGRAIWARDGAEWAEVDDRPDRAEEDWVWVAGAVAGAPSGGWAARAGFLGRVVLRTAGRDAKSGGEVEGGVGRLRELGMGGAVRVVGGRCWSCGWCWCWCCEMLAGAGCCFSADD